MTGHHICCYSLADGERILTIIMFSADRYTVISVSDIGQNTEISDFEHNNDKIGWIFSHDTQRY